jgi:hypothetical protein
MLGVGVRGRKEAEMYASTRSLTAENAHQNEKPNAIREKDAHAKIL